MKKRILKFLLVFLSMMIGTPIVVFCLVKIAEWSATHIMWTLIILLTGLSALVAWVYAVEE